MKRNISITVDSSKTDLNIVYINNISSIVNYSCDSIFIDCLEYLIENDHSIIIKALLEKLRQDGRLIIVFNNTQTIAEKFINRSISHTEFLRYFSNKQSLVSIESLYTMVNFQLFNILDIDINDSTIKLVLERKSI